LKNLIFTVIYPSLLSLL
jgi:hypothetical protein